MSLPPTLNWKGDARHGCLEIIDQTRLPGELQMLELRTLDALIEAIQVLRVRGAPALGVAGAFGVVLALREGAGLAGIERLADARPTAVNLRWAVERTACAAEGDPERALTEALAIHEDDARRCRAIGEHGASLLHNGMTVLTHCNAGALATGGIGTALAPLYVAHQRGLKLKIYADETRPLLQGARLTAWELSQAGLDVTVLADSAAASLLQAGRIDLVVTGADRIARNGDAANKVGTCGLAALASLFEVPFHVAAPKSTFDPRIATGAEIEIEQRGEEELRRLGPVQLAPNSAKIYNPAFDVTPAGRIRSFITEDGLIAPEEVFGWLEGA